MARRDRYEEQVRQHYEKTGEQLLIAEHTNKSTNPVVVKPETEGFGKVVHRWEREEKGHSRWI
jgi:hypothetical protein